MVAIYILLIYLSKVNRAFKFCKKEIGNDLFLNLWDHFIGPNDRSISGYISHIEIIAKEMIFVRRAPLLRLESRRREKIILIA